LRKNKDKSGYSDNSPAKFPFELLIATTIFEEKPSHRQILHVFEHYLLRTEHLSAVTFNVY